jgi:tRNA dimethylallyltransferase
VDTQKKTPVLCVAGPTASGKSALAVKLAKALGGEIVSMDSMQIYRRMDVGTAKPTLTERGGVPHHMLDVAEPAEAFSVAQYAEMAECRIREIYERGRLPILAGGTGFYLRALTDGLALGGVQSDPELRQSLKDSAADEAGKRRLYAQLAEADPATAARLHPNDVGRVSRALEVYRLTGKPMSVQENAPGERPFRFCMVGATLERQALYERIEMRVDAMLAGGLLGEVRSLLESGVPPAAQAMQGIGYKELTPVLLAGAPPAEAVALIKRNTRRYAKRQWTWFNAEKRIRWLDMAKGESTDEALRIGDAFWRENRA